jgi:uncharacterized protein (TIGR02145 family)
MQRIRGAARFLVSLVFSTVVVACGNDVEKSVTINAQPNGQTNNLLNNGAFGDIGQSCDVGCAVVCIRGEFCSDRCNGDDECPTGFFCRQPDPAGNRVCDREVAGELVGRDCDLGCEDGFCINDGGQEFCTRACTGEGDCPSPYVCESGGPPGIENFCGIDTTMPPDALQYDSPPNAGRVNIDEGFFFLRWSGGFTPYEVEFGPSGDSLQRLATVTDARELPISTEQLGIGVDENWFWRVTSAAGTDQEEVGPIWSFRTTSDALPTCPNQPTVQFEGETYGTLLVGNTCWLDRNITAGVEVADRTRDDQVLEKLCPGGGCDDNAFYTAWEMYNSYPADVRDLSGRDRVVCPDGWDIPTQQQVGELVASISPFDLSNFFPLDDSRVPQSRDLETCTVNNQTVACTSFIGSGNSDRTAYLWMQGTVTDLGHQYFRVEFDNGTWTANYGRRGGSFANSVRCTRAR